MSYFYDFLFIFRLKSSCRMCISSNNLFIIAYCGFVTAISILSNTTFCRYRKYYC